MATNHPPPNNPSSTDLEKLGFVRYTGDIPFDQLEFPDERPNEDFEWAWNNPELQKAYYGKVAAIHNRTVWGVGKTSADALNDARNKPGCPAAEELTFVPIC